MVRKLLFVSIILVAVSMAATWAHLREMPAKLTLSRNDYFTVQQIYRGWAYLGIVIFAALATTATLAVLARHERALAFGGGAAALCIVLALVVFFSYTFPANQATVNWTTIPDNWSALRRQWEYAHAVEAILYFVALLSLVAAAVRRV